MNFSPEYLATYIVRPLRYLFENYAPEDIRWADDPKLTGIEIGTINSFHKEGIQQKPRILISRGSYQVTHSGLSDNLAEAKGIWAAKGKREGKYQLFINGVAQVMVQARQQGACEKISNLVQHFLGWTGPMLADTYGFKTTFVPMSISNCTTMPEDGEVFSVTINLPWTKEEHFQVSSGDTIQFKSFLLKLVNDGPDIPVRMDGIVDEPFVPTPTPPASPVSPIPYDQVFSYLENQPSGAAIGTIATSPGTTVTDFRFYQTSTNLSPDGYFAVNSTGDVVLTDLGATSANDFETSESTFLYQVQALDADQTWSPPVYINVQLTDINDRFPVIDPEQSFSYNEGQTSIITVGQVTVDGFGNPVMGFRFGDTGTQTSSDGYYTIDDSGIIKLTTAGIVSIAPSNDYETLPNTFIYGIQAQNFNGWSPSVDVTINVIDVDEFGFVNLTGIPVPVELSDSPYTATGRNLPITLPVQVSDSPYTASGYNISRPVITNLSANKDTLVGTSTGLAVPALVNDTSPSAANGTGVQAVPVNFNRT